MKNNRYLEELGIKEEELCKIYNKEDEEGFSEYEMYNLDYNMALYIYSKLCYFRDTVGNKFVPGCLCGTGKNSKEGEEKWSEVLDKMIEGFKLKIICSREGYEEIDNKKIKEGMELFVNYYDCLWY